ncbi:hypothetical protein OCH80_02295 [Lactobacillus sp. 23-2]|uniref:hypothetical protein n=1 Tax=Lactobacillus sp. 23-2 TaxID=2981842 RepID=UPI0038373EE9
MSKIKSDATMTDDLDCLVSQLREDARKAGIKPDERIYVWVKPKVSFSSATRKFSAVMACLVMPKASSVTIKLHKADGQRKPKEVQRDLMEGMLVMIEPDGSNPFKSQKVLKQIMQPAEEMAQRLNQQFNDFLRTHPDKTQD